MTVSICVIAYNEQKFIQCLLDDLKKQTYPHSLTEIILVDSNSEDNTKEIMRHFKEAYQSEYIDIKVLDNPKKIQAAGWNVAILNATSDVIIRIDAHTRIPARFTEKNMKLQDSGEYITGGVRPCIIENPTAWKKTLLEIENSLFGSSIAPSRHSTKKKYVNSMFHAAYRREVFNKSGMFNENLLRTEDNEMHYRMRKAGFRFCFDPDIISYQYARSSLKKMIKQKYGNGYWIGLTTGICPKCISLYHFVPCAFLLGIVFTSILAKFGIWQLAAMMWGIYFFFVLINIGLIIRKGKGNKWTWCMPAIFILLHVTYGVGTLMGIIMIPFIKNKLARR